MPPKKILIVSVSASSFKSSLLYSSFLKKTPHIDYVGYDNNVKSLASIYNKYISEAYEDYIVVFVHDDVYICDSDFTSKCRSAIESYDVFGVAGGRGSISIDPLKPALWHLISKERVGSVGHFAANQEIDYKVPYKNRSWVTTFGESPSKASVVDGVFFGVNVEQALKKGVSFDESCPARFHFYDMLFCVNAKVQGMRIGVFPFALFHVSHGLTNPNEEFHQGDRYFKSYCNEVT